MAGNEQQQGQVVAVPGPESSAPDFMGKYRLIAHLGTGGMADVHLAVAKGAMDVNRLVVIKRLRDEQSNDDNSREMFLNEARLAARLNHPNVVHVSEAGADDDAVYFVMEYVEGQPLSRLLSHLRHHASTGGAINPRLAARIVAEALAGLHYAHELCDFDGTPLGIVHRDVSPQNIMVTYDGVVKIVDFGIAKVVGSNETAHGVFKGKVSYMAPEQVLCQAVDRRADVFAAGIVLWEAVTGQRLMADKNPAKTLHNVLSKVIPRASSVTSVPPELDDVIARALEREVDKRFASAKEMRDALETYIAGEANVRTEEIGELMVSIFSEVREKTRRQVRAQIAELSLMRPPNSSTRLKVRDVGVIDLSEMQESSRNTGHSRPATAEGINISIVQQSDAPRRRKKLALVSVFGVALAVAAVGFGLATWKATKPTALAPAVPEAAPPAAIPATAAPEARPAPTEVAAPAASRSAPALSSSAASSHARRGHDRAPSPVVVSPAAPPAQRSASAPPPVEAAPSPKPSHAAPAPAETSQGRTFRREL